MKHDQQRLDQYELQQCLRRDTTSEVWKAFDTQQRRYVTLALLRFTLPTDEAIPCFLRETRPLMALRHPYLVPILEMRLLSRTTSASSSNSEAYIVMDYVEGLSLTEYLHKLNQTRKTLSPAEIMQILAPIGEAIDYIHQQGIIHGLITPSAILLSKNSESASPLGEPRLMDLGMHNTYDPHQLSPKEVCYIAPEIIQGDTNNVRSDLYSLGIIIYEMSTGTLPFRGATTAEVISQQL
ncbi:MAG TPA: serine/threonine-protein kinase, partial [Ktedonobacteraceae bacterium]|nr:serine/threonine-protein kinase [Ktedonobacteraceae bacterium]